MLQTERHRAILELLDENISVSGNLLVEKLAVTPMTIWRDLKVLEEQGLLMRIRGGAQKIDVQAEARFDKKLDAARRAKIKIANYAANHFIEPNDVLALEGGTTVSMVADFIKQPNVTILSNSIPVINKVYASPGKTTAYCSGGLLRPESGTLVGREAITFFSKRRTKTFFMSATSLDLEHGLSDPNPQEIEVKQSMFVSADRTILLMDTSKLGTRSLMEVIALRQIDIAVFDSPIPVEYRNLLKSNKIEIHEISK